MAALRALQADITTLAVDARNLRDSRQFHRTLRQIQRDGSSIHGGLLSLKTDPHPREYRWRPVGAEETRESVASVKAT